MLNADNFQESFVSRFDWRESVLEIDDKLPGEKEGLYLNASTAEEITGAYKCFAGRVNIMHDEGITSKVAKLKPMGVIKGL